jgi:D-alanyl-D-alanine carboxypeptidase
MRVWKVSGMILIAVGLAVTVACSRASLGLDDRLQSLVAQQVKDGSGIRNCALAMANGDGSFEWSGASGMATGQTLMTKDTPIYVASITKLYTATIVMRLCEQGLLALDDPMAKYLPKELVQGIHVYKGQDYSSHITIRQLLSHSSGIADYYDQKGADSKTLFEIFVENPDRRWTVDQTIERAKKDLQPRFPPGEGTSYSDTNFQLLGKIIEAVTGKPLQDAYEELIFRPLGLKHTYLVGYGADKILPSALPADVFSKGLNITKVRSNGSYWADGGIVSTAEEMIVFMKALNAGQIVSRNALGQMHDWRRWRFPMEYGFGTMLFSFPRPMRSLMQMPPLWGHSGSSGSFLFYCSDADLYLAGTIDQTNSQIKPFFLMYQAIKAVANARGIKDGGG